MPDIVDRGVGKARAGPVSCEGSALGSVRAGPLQCCPHTESTAPPGPQGTAPPGPSTLVELELPLLSSQLECGSAHIVVNQSCVTLYGDSPLHIIHNDRDLGGCEFPLNLVLYALPLSPPPVYGDWGF